MAAVGEFKCSLTTLNGRWSRHHANGRFGGATVIDESATVAFSGPKSTNTFQNRAITDIVLGETESCSALRFVIRATVDQVGRLIQDAPIVCSASVVSASTSSSIPSS
jgi:hypothetical protein